MSEMWDAVMNLQEQITELRKENRQMHKDLAALLAVMDTDIARLKRLAGDDLRLVDMTPAPCFRHQGMTH